MGEDGVVVNVTVTNEIEIVVTEPAGIARTGEFVRVGVPCPKATIWDTESLCLLTAENQAQSCQSSILGTWHDGSVKWLLLDFAATLPPHGRMIYRLLERPASIPPAANPVSIEKKAEYWRVSTGVAEFIVDTSEFRPFRSVTVNSGDTPVAGCSACLLEVEGRSLTPCVDTVVAESEGPLRSVLRLEGCFDAGAPASPRFSCRMHFFSGSSQVMLDFSLHNPRAASHPGGLWDLGDSGSLLFKELSLRFPLTRRGDSVITCSPEPGLPLLRCQPSAGGMRVCQESSGGENWNSPVHRTRDGAVRLRYRGYEVTHGGQRISGGRRATPVVWCGEGGVGVSAVMPLFWQEFPKAFTIDADELTVELFPGCSPDLLHELQGGERKTTSLCLDFAASPEGLAWARSPLVAVPSPETCRRSSVFFDLPPTTTGGDAMDLVDRFASPDNLIHKREIVDEYGWRHFGDFYADHEAVFHGGKLPFVSHYNNQYDLCGGLYRKFLATGGTAWGQLASDLARHVCDIDLYHTDQDRQEFNRGLFWHTDHYIDAGLSTHRTCSREHLAVKDPRYCGGGPGAEHCYTTGLLYHYFQTGNPAFRDAVISLADWVLGSLSGTATVLDVVKKTLRNLSLLRATAQKHCRVFPKYPLTRGTGNAVTACLDAYEVSADTRFLAEAESLIRGALHPGDDIDARNLLDPESAWSYTVLLVAVAKFLDKKRELHQLDSAYGYARSCLLAYAEWMLDHEYPYLEKPDVLEYPNETWAAQDLRKSVLFWFAAAYAPPGRGVAFLERATFFYDSASAELLRHPTSSFTRPIALMLQNGWIGAALSRQGALPSHGEGEGDNSHLGRPTPCLTFSAVVARLFSDLPVALKNTNIKKELAWLKARLKR